MKTGIELIAEERKKHIGKGYDYTHDIIVNADQQLSQCAEMLLAVDHEEGIDPASFPDSWDEDHCQRMIGKSRYERLIIAGALIAAELDREIFLLHELEEPLSAPKSPDQEYERYDTNADAQS